jgi:Sulfotransferase family
MINLRTPAVSRTHWPSSALSLLRRPHFSVFRTYIRRDLGLGVVFNPKVGSTAFRKILVEGMQRTGIRPILGPYWPVPLRRRYLTASPTDYLHALLGPQRYRFYCFVRNPYSRLLSGWRDKLAFCHGGATVPRDMRRVVPALRRFATRHGLPGGESDAFIPFSTFVGFVESQPEGTRNRHWDTQQATLFPDVIAYHRIFRMETEFAVGMTEILTRLGLPEPWVSDRLRQRDRASRPWPEPVYDAALADRVHRIYACDFEQFGYDPQSWRGL